MTQFLTELGVQPRWFCYLRYVLITVRPAERGLSAPSVCLNKNIILHFYFHSDVNECASNNGHCDHTCANEQGSYKCTCNTGYDLYTTDGFNGLYLDTGEDGSKPWHTFHVNHSCVCRFFLNLFTPFFSLVYLNTRDCIPGLKECG